MKCLKKLTTSGGYSGYICCSLVMLLMLLYPFSAVASDKVRLQLSWQHHFQFAGYYAAKEKGYYQEAGVDVELVPSKLWDDPVQKVLEGKAQFGVGSTDLLLRRENGAPVVVLAVIFQDALLESTAREWQEHRFDSPHPAGIDLYGDNLFTTERLIQMKPKMVSAFREASIKGWEYAMQHPEEMVQLIYSRYSQGHSIEQLRTEALHMLPLLHASLVEIGHLNPVRWNYIAEVYAGLGIMEPGFDLRGFLYDPNPPPPDLRWIYVVLATALALVLAAALLIIRFSNLSTALKSTIADYKLVGEALHVSESLYRSILQASPDDITITDTEGNIRMVSPAGLAMFGYEREEELLGRNAVEFISLEDQERARVDMARMFQGPFPVVGEYRAIRQDDTIFDIETNSQFIRDADGQPVSIVFIIRDITERKRAGHSCLVAMGEMIGAIAHQWRQPLATLGMIIQRAHAVGTMQMLTPEKMDEFKANAMRQIRYMSDTIEEFRGFYRTEKQKELFSPLNCINDSVRLFEPQFTSHGIAVDVHCRECDERLVAGYPNEFKQVILNLLGNARDAILESRKTKVPPEDGRITIRISVREDKTMTIDVNDNGCGVPDDIVPRILDPYFTTKEDSGGTGLGLYMSRRIVEDSLGGHLTLLQCQVGATFRIELQLGKLS